MRVRTILLLAATLGATAARPQAAASAGRPLDITADLRLLPGGGETLQQRGAFSGAPLGKGTVTLRTSVGHGKGATFSFRMVNARGRVEGSGDVALDFKGSTVTYRGTAKITGGDGAFRTVRATNLTVNGSGPLTGETFKVRLTGTVSS